MELLVPIAILALMWAVLILPQQRRVRAHRAYVETLQVGDDVVTTAGLFGTVTALEGERVLLRIAPDVEVTVARLSIGRPQSALPAPDASSTPDPSPEDRE